MQTLPISYLHLLSTQLTPRHSVRLIHLFPGTISNLLCHPHEKYDTEKLGGVVVGALGQSRALIPTLFVCLFPFLVPSCRWAN